MWQVGRALGQGKGKDHGTTKSNATNYTQHQVTNLHKTRTPTMKQATIRIRIPSRLRDDIKNKPNTNMSAVIKSAMKKYLNGERSFPVKDKDIVPTTVLIDEKVAKEFSDLAKAHGYSFDAAVRLALATELDETK